MIEILLAIVLALPASNAPETVSACNPDMPTRISGEGFLEEDESPYTGLCRGSLVAYSDGIAYYDDGSWTDGTDWHHYQ